MHIFNALLTSILVLVIIAVFSVAARKQGILEKNFSAGLASKITAGASLFSLATLLLVIAMVMQVSVCPIRHLCAV
ncbi:MAG: hypothetical protein R2791_00220 [Saprospiraceae bacterium]